MSDGVANDVRRMDVRQFIDDLSTSPAGLNQSRPSQHPQVLTDEWLRRPDRVDQFVNAVGVIREQVDNGEPNRRSESAEERARCLISPYVGMRYGEFGSCVDPFSHDWLPCTYAP
jgi:hypothetical protein